MMLGKIKRSVFYKLKLFDIHISVTINFYLNTINHAHLL